MEVSQPTFHRNLAIAIGLGLLTFAAFLPALRCGFTDFDDPDYVTSNHHVLDGLSAANFRWAWTTAHSGYWQPLSWLSLMLDATISHGDPWFFHLTNVLLHALSAGVVFWVLQSMTGAAWRSALVAALYAVHPLRVESVAWIAERKDVLSNLLAWLTIAGYVAYTRRPDSRRYFLVIVTFVLGLLAKPMIATLPCVLLLLDFWPLRRTQRWKQLLWEKTPLFAAALVAGGVAAFDQSQIGATLGLRMMPVISRLGTALHGYGQYLWKTIWPAGLSVFYPLPLHWQSRRPIEIVISAAAVALLSILSILQRHRRPWLLVGWFWFLGVIAPVSGIFQSGVQDLADRFTYLASVGLLVMLIWSIPAAVTLIGRRAQFAAAAAVLVCLCTATWIQTGYWRDTRTLFTRALELDPNNWLAHDLLAVCLFREGDQAGALAESRKSLQINETDPVAHYNLAKDYANHRKFQLAAGEYRDVLLVRPNEAPIHADYGVTLQNSGDLQGAYREFTRAIALNPNYAAAHSDLGGLLGEIGLLDKADAELQLALKLAPGDPPTLAKIAAISALRSRAAAADTGRN